MLAIRCVRMTFVLLLVSAATVEAQAPQDVHSQPLRVSYDATVALDLVDSTLHAVWQLEFVPEIDSEQRVALLLNRGMQIHRLEGKAVRSYHIESFHVPYWSQVIIELDDSVSTEPSTFYLEYSGKLELPYEVNLISSDWVELNIESMWHPLLATTDREMVGVLRVSLPPEWHVVGVGPATFQSDSHIIHNSVPQIDVAFVAAPEFRRTSGENFTVYHTTADDFQVETILEGAELCAEYLNARYGATRPLPYGHLVVADRAGASYARATFMVFSRFEDPENRKGIESGICHELTHYWTAFGNFMGPDHWMSEAFPEFVAAKYLRDRFGQTAFDEKIAAWRDTGSEAGPVWTPESTQRPSGAAMYVLAPYLLHRLETRIGEEKFDRFVALYMEENVRATEELLLLLNRLAGAAASTEFQRELASPGSAALSPIELFD